MTALVSRFRRVLVVDALVWSGRIDDIRAAEALAGRDLLDVEPALDGLWSLHVRTAEGRLVVPPGWRLMYGPDGGVDAVPGDVFAATGYEPAAEEPGRTPPSRRHSRAESA